MLLMITGCHQYNTASLVLLPCPFLTTGGGGYGGGGVPNSGYYNPGVTQTPSYGGGGYTPTPSYGGGGGGGYTPTPSSSYTPSGVTTTPRGSVTGGTTGSGAVPGVTAGTRPTTGGYTTPTPGSSSGTGGTWPTSGVNSTLPRGNSPLSAPVTRPGTLFGTTCTLNVTVNSGVSTAGRPARYAWSVSVTSDADNKAVTLSESGDTSVKYFASVTRSNTPQPVYAATGTITVTNPSSTQPVTASAVLAVLGDGQGSAGSNSSSQTVAARAACGQPFPLTIAANASVQCTFDLEVPSQQAGQVSAVVMLRSGDRCYSQQGMPFAFSSSAAQPAQQPAAASAAGDCTVLSIRFPRRDITVSSIVLDQSVADEDGSSSSSTAAGQQNVSVLARRTLCKPAKFGFTANFKAQPGFLNCSDTQVRHLSSNV